MRKLPVAIIIVGVTSLVSISVVAALASQLLQTSSSPPQMLLLPSPPTVPKNDDDNDDKNNEEKVGFYSDMDNNGISFIADAKGDARPDKQYQTSIVPSVMGYHDILWAGISKINVAANNDSNTSFLLTIGLAGDPNLNEKYETTYVWHIMTSSNNNVYTVILPNFAPDSSFAANGWYFAVYNNTGGKYIVPMTRIFSSMPKDRVEFPLDASLVGDPQSFHYWVSVHARVDSQNLDKPPDYLMDYAP